MKNLRAALAIAGLLAATTSSGAAETPRQRVPAGVPASLDDVDLRTGGFTITYEAFAGKSGIAYQRTYRSPVAAGGYIFKGSFGRGWGATFDTRLRVMPDNSIVVMEEGNATATIYGRPTQTARNKAIETIADAALKTDEVSPSERAEVIKVLSGSLPLTVVLAEMYEVSGSLAPGTILDIDPGSATSSRRCPDSWVKWNGLGQRVWAVERQLCGGTSENFNDKGLLVTSRQSGSQWSLRVERSGELIQDVRSVDLLASKPRAEDPHLAFAHRWSGGARSLTVTDEAGGMVEYKFDKAGFNTSVRTKDGAAYEFAYDEDGNMTDIGFPDTTHRRMAYDADGRVATVTGRNGELTTFTYRTVSGRSETEVRRTIPGRRADTAIVEFEN